MPRFVWYELMTTDPAAAADFYARVVGWDVEISPLTDAGYRIVKVGDRAIGGILPTMDDVKDMPPRWYGYVGVEDVDAAAAKLAEAGGRVFRPPTTIPNVGRFAVVADPQFVPFMLFTPPAGQTAPPGLAECTPGTVAWHELHTPDPVAALDFYIGQFGWEKDDLRDSPIGPIQFVRCGTTAADGSVLKAPGAPGWIYYFSVADIDAATQAIRDLGGSITHGPTPIPCDRFITLATDPQGATFELVGQRKG